MKLHNLHQIVHVHQHKKSVLNLPIISMFDYCVDKNQPAARMHSLNIDLKRPIQQRKIRIRRVHTLAGDDTL